MSNRAARRAAKARNKSNLVQCDEHGECTGYAICKHILEQGKPVRAVTHPNPDATGIRRTIGSIVCHEMHPDEHSIDDGPNGIVILCKRCADEKGFTRVLQ